MPKQHNRNELYHYGVKGMRWRKTEDSDTETDRFHSRQRHDSGQEAEVHRRDDGPHSRKRHPSGASARVTRRKTLKGSGVGSNIIWSRKPGKKTAGSGLFVKRK